MRRCVGITALSLVLRSRSEWWFQRTRQRIVLALVAACVVAVEALLKSKRVVVRSARCTVALPLESVVTL